ncbi:EAL domain-containing protein [Paracoccus sp. NGMCC 1.201697]|uniref:EAL domain-containing protein n=1 Tax=Paracoccus broussonetiae subsp. drimophilus TaxID=3373869 RepID=A0ABW7LG66_9RHOB
MDGRTEARELQDETGNIPAKGCARESIRDRQRIGAELGLALSRRQLSVRFQPQLRLADGTVSGFEALARWHSPVLGEVEPERFIPVAEEAGLIGEIGAWVIETAVAEIAALDLPDTIRLAVNVSAIQMRDPGFPKRVALILAASGFPPRRLELEITEGICLCDEATAAASIAALHGMGISIVLDDFGAGYGNLVTLGKYDFDRLKLDRNLLRELSGTVRGERIIEWAVTMAGSVGLDVIAEGVETAAQAEFLRGIGCEHAQGFLYAPPLPIGQLTQWYRNHRPAPALE